MGISVDISGNVYVTEFNNDRIQVFTKWSLVKKFLEIIIQLHQ
jgi:hypothetical protein